jgi:hypothetical protein
MANDLRALGPEIAPAAGAPGVLGQTLSGDVPMHTTLPLTESLGSSWRDRKYMFASCIVGT